MGWKVPFGHFMSPTLLTSTKYNNNNKKAQRNPQISAKISHHICEAKKETKRKRKKTPNFKLQVENHGKIEKTNREMHVFLMDPCCQSTSSLYFVFFTHRLDETFHINQYLVGQILRHRIPVSYAMGSIAIFILTLACSTQTTGNSVVPS